LLKSAALLKMFTVVYCFCWGKVIAECWLCKLWPHQRSKGHVQITKM